MVSSRSICARLAIAWKKRRPAGVFVSMPSVMLWKCTFWVSSSSLTRFTNPFTLRPRRSSFPDHEGIGLAQLGQCLFQLRTFDLCTAEFVRENATFLEDLTFVGSASRKGRFSRKKICLAASCRFAGLKQKSASEWRLHRHYPSAVRWQASLCPAILANFYNR
jgi:hypothetical protein